MAISMMLSRRLSHITEEKVVLQVTQHHDSDWSRRRLPDVKKNLSGLTLMVDDLFEESPAQPPRKTEIMADGTTDTLSFRQVALNFILH